VGLGSPGGARAARLPRKAFLALLDAMDNHDLGRDRKGLMAALAGLRAPLSILGLDPDLLFPPSVVKELAEAATAAGVRCTLAWIDSIQGHDAFLIEWPQVEAWLRSVFKEVAP